MGTDMERDALTTMLGWLVLKRRPDGRFVRVGAAPTWCASLNLPALHATAPFAVSEIFPYVATFLEAAERTWRRQGPPASSGFWTEVAASRESLHLEATALPADGADVLIIARDEMRFAQAQLVLQRARELRLAHDALVRELEQKDVLLHAVVHELIAPTYRMLRTISLARDEAPGGAVGERLRELDGDVREQTRTLTALLEAFSAELGDNGGPVDGAVGLSRVVDEVVTSLIPVATRRRVQVDVSKLAHAWVAVDEPRLHRVLDHLIGEPVYDSPAGAVVRVQSYREGEWIRFVVEDPRASLPVEAVPRLFERVGAVGVARAAGSGLYFCRITAERWGGGIGYEPTAEGGRRFWVRLPRAQRPGQANEG